MKWGRQQKVLFQVKQYTPGPGYYAQENNKNKHKNLSVFQSTLDRIPIFVNQNPGPGQYYTKKPWIKSKRCQLEPPFRLKHQLQQIRHNEEQKIKQMPSIAYKYKDSIFSLVEDLQKKDKHYQKDQIGPGTYNTNLQVIKKKPIQYSIPKYYIIIREHRSKRRQPPQPPVVNSNQQQHLNKSFHKPKLQKKFIQLQKPELFNSNPQNLCLELIILREKMLKPDQGPEPGKYYDNQKQSSFKNIQKAKQFQCFDSRLVRKIFEEPKMNIGPGQYELNQQISKEKGIRILQSKRNNLIINNNEISNPGPGSYFTNSLKFNKLSQKKNNISLYSSAFGTGNKRFDLSTNSNHEVLLLYQPGPGSYNLAKRYTKTKNRKVSAYSSYISNPKDSKSQTQLSIGEINKQNTQWQKVRKPVGTFSKDAKNVIMESQHIGPGSYQFKNGWIKQSFNKKSHGSKGERFKQVQMAEMGPGYYEYSNQILNNKKVYNIHL